ncbi:MAG: hypothetical protein ACTSUL_07025 [Promethearchaeota archaeon]
MAISKLIKQEDELQVLLRTTKNLILSKNEINELENKEKLIQHLKDDPDNVEFEYVVKFHAYTRAISDDQAYINALKEFELKDLDYEIEWYPQWSVKKKKDYIEILF